MQYQEIILGELGQRFVFDPTNGQVARLPRPTVRVIAADEAVPATIGVCEVDPVTTTLVGDVQSGSRTIRVASTEGIEVGGRYVMIKPERDREWIEVIGIRDGMLALKHPVIHRYAGAATIEGCRISVAIDPDWVQSSANVSERRAGLAGYMLRWTYTADGFEMSGVSFADLVRRRVSQIVDARDVAARNPGFAMPTGTDYIAEAFNAIRLEAIGNSHAQRKIRDDRVLRELATTRANVIRLEQEVMHGAPRADELAIAEHRYRRQYSRLIERPKLYEPPEPPESIKQLKASTPGTPRRIPKLTNH